MKTTPRTICTNIAAALAISMLAGACGGSDTDRTVVESSADSTTEVEDTNSSAGQSGEQGQLEYTSNSSDSGSQASTQVEGQDASGSDTAASQSAPAAESMNDDTQETTESGATEDDGYDHNEPIEDDSSHMPKAPTDAAMDEDGMSEGAMDEGAMAEEAMDEETMNDEAMGEEALGGEAMTMSQPETAGEDCDAIKDRNELRLDIESPAVVINNDIARPGDACDFHMLYIDGMSKGVNSNGIVQLSITCDNPDDVEVALSGPGGFDYRHGASNGQRYACGDTWTESVNYQSDKVFFTVYIRPLRETGASSYQVVALPVPT